MGNAETGVTDDTPVSRYRDQHGDADDHLHPFVEQQEPLDAWLGAYAPTRRVGPPPAGAPSLVGPKDHA